VRSITCGGAIPCSIWISFFNEERSGADEPDGAGREPARLERRPQHVVDERGHGAERGPAGAQHGRVEALQQLAGDVQGDVRARLEVRADRADGNAPLAHAEPVRQRPRPGLALERLDLGHRLDLARQCLQAGVVEPKPIESALVDGPGGARDVGRVRVQDQPLPLTHERAAAPQRSGDPFVVESRNGRGGRRRLAFDVLTKAHFTSYTGFRTRGTPRSASREAEGPAL